MIVPTTGRNAALPTPDPVWEVRWSDGRTQTFDTLAAAFHHQLVDHTNGADPGVLWHRTLRGDWVTHPEGRP